MMMQSIRTTIVAHTTNGLAPIIPLLLCAPKYRRRDDDAW